MLSLQIHQDVSVKPDTILTQLEAVLAVILNVQLVHQLIYAKLVKTLTVHHQTQAGVFASLDII